MMKKQHLVWKIGLKKREVIYLSVKPLQHEENS